MYSVGSISGYNILSDRGLTLYKGITISFDLSEKLRFIIPSILLALLTLSTLHCFSHLHRVSQTQDVGLIYLPNRTETGLRIKSETGLYKSITPSVWGRGRLESWLLITDKTTRSSAGIVFNQIIYSSFFAPQQGRHIAPNHRSRSCQISPWSAHGWPQNFENLEFYQYIKPCP